MFAHARLRFNFKRKCTKETETETAKALGFQAILHVTSQYQGPTFRILQLEYGDKLGA